MPDVPDATDNESAREEEKENRVDETIIFKDNDNKESAMEMDSGNETINDSITYPNQTSSNQPYQPCQPNQTKSNETNQN